MLYGAMNHPMIDVHNEIDNIGSLGFDFIDLTLEPRETYSAIVEVDKVAKSLEKNNLKAVGHTAYYLPITSPYPEFRKQALKELERCIKVFKDLGIDRMNVHPQTKAPLHDEQWVVAQNIESFAYLEELGKKMNILIMLENMPGFSRPSQLMPIFESVKELGLLLDVGHANLDTPYNRCEELLANFGEKLSHVHISDNHGHLDDEHLPIGVGSINWQKIIQLIKNVGYDATMTLEIFSDDDDYLVISRNKFRKLWDSI